MTIDISPEADENLWRFWANKAQALADENKALSPALATLAMRERAAYECDVYVTYLKAGEASLNDNLGKHIRSLPTTFTHAELLAAAMQLPEVRTLVDAASKTEKKLNIINYNSLGLYANSKIAGDVIVELRAALAPFMKETK